MSPPVHEHLTITGLKGSPRNTSPKTPGSLYIVAEMLIHKLFIDAYFPLRILFYLQLEKLTQASFLITSTSRGA